MPRLALGAGIAQGAQAFVQSFMQARMMEEQKKFQKNQIILQALNMHLADENLPYRKRFQMLNAIPGLLGVKLDRTLTEEWGLEDLLDDEVEIEPAQAGTGASAQLDTKNKTAPAIQGDTTQGELSIEESPIAGAVYQQGTETVPAKTAQMGDLSPAKYKQLLKNRQDALDTEREIERARRVAEINFELQQKSFKAQGYNKELAEGFNESGEYVVLMGNAEGDVKEVKMPKGFKPLNLLVAQQRGQGLPSAVKAYAAYFAGQTNPTTGLPYTPEEANQMAVELYKERGDTLANLREQQTKLGITKGTQEVTGTKPIQPGEDIDNQRAAEQVRVQRETNLINLEKDVTTAATELAGLEEEIKDAEDDASARFLEFGIGDDGKPISRDNPAYRDNSAAANYSPGDPEWNRAEQALTDAKNKLSRLKAKKQSLQAKLNAAREAAEKYKKTIGGSSSSSSVTSEQIKIFRSRNASNPRYSKMSDEEIRDFLERNKDRWRK